MATAFGDVWRALSVKENRSVRVILARRKLREAKRKWRAGANQTK